MKVLRRLCTESVQILVLVARRISKFCTKCIQKQNLVEACTDFSKDSAHNLAQNKNYYEQNNFQTEFSYLSFK